MWCHVDFYAGVEVTKNIAVTIFMVVSENWIPAIQNIQTAVSSKTLYVCLCVCEYIYTHAHTNIPRVMSHKNGILL
jgi:hypothetical protein